jgi:hypothetical protein
VILMLTFMFLCVAVGLFTRDVSGRLFFAIAAAALVMCSLYLYAPWLM